MDAAPPAIPAAQHNTEIRSNQASWEKKPLIRKIYRIFYELIRERLQHGVAGLTVELGSGQGRIKEVIPDCVTTDIFPNPWLDRQENAYALSFPDRSVGNLILFDVWHHLEYPGEALREAARVVAPGGRVILFEPAMGWLGRLVYGVFHHEPLGVRHAFSWLAPRHVSLTEAPYFAAQASASRFFWWRERRDYLQDWNLVEVKPLAAVYYVASGGFSRAQLIPSCLLPVFKALDPILGLVPRLFACRLLVVLERRAPDTP